MNSWRCLRLLRNPLPGLLCLLEEQVLSWTQERGRRDRKTEGRREGAANTERRSLETVTAWNHRLLDEPTPPLLHTSRHTQKKKKNTDAQIQSFVQEKTYDTAVHYSS